MRHLITTTVVVLAAAPAAHAAPPGCYITFGNNCGYSVSGGGGWSGGNHGCYGAFAGSGAARSNPFVSFRSNPLPSYNVAPSGGAAFNPLATAAYNPLPSYNAAPMNVAYSPAYPTPVPHAQPNYETNTAPTYFTSAPVMTSPADAGARNNAHASTPTLRQVPLSLEESSSARNNPFASTGNNRPVYVTPDALTPPAVPELVERPLRNRYVKLRNSSSVPLTFHVQYHKVINAVGKWSDSPLPGVRLQPGEEVYLSHNGYRVSAERIRFHAVTDDGRKLGPRTLVLGTSVERDAGGYLLYRATYVGTYTYTVSHRKPAAG